MRCQAMKSSRPSKSRRALPFTCAGRFSGMKLRTSERKASSSDEKVRSMASFSPTFCQYKHSGRGPRCKTLLAARGAASGLSLDRLVMADDFLHDKRKKFLREIR